MIKNHVKKILFDEFSFKTTESQSNLLKNLANYITSDGIDEIFLIRGYAGTGKTTIIKALSRTLDAFKIKSVLMAPTGRAAKVVANTASQPAFTIHKTIYQQMGSSDGLGKFVLRKNLYKNTYFIIDEASMISNESYGENSTFGSGELLKDCLRYVFAGDNCRLIFVGDTAQLPPVGLVTSPALDATNLVLKGFTVHDFELTEVVRQKNQSGILQLATLVRYKINENNIKGFFQLPVEGLNDVIKLSGENLIEELSTCYDNHGLHKTIVITRSNKRAGLYNKGIRGSILYKENEIEVNDLLMIVKNNYFWTEKNSKIDFIANGDSAEIVQIYGYEEMYGFRFADVSLKFSDYYDEEIDCKILLETLVVETASLSRDRSNELYFAVAEDYMHIKNKRKRWEAIRNNPYFNALQVKFAYAITCHKAQGGQWNAVFVDHGYVVEEMLDREYYRWLYTAFTRPTEKLYLVNFNKRFFNLDE